MHEKLSCLADALEKQSVKYQQRQLEQLNLYVDLLQKWNRVYNLTAIRDRNAIVVRHILDSLSVLDYLQGEVARHSLDNQSANVVDVGAGAGLPGIPLAIMLPEIQFVELESNAKKTRFMQQVVMELGLGNVNVENRRCEEMNATPAFSVVISRAFASLSDMLKGTMHLCRSNGCFLAMKGACSTEELASVPEEFNVQGVHQLHVAGLDEQRQIVHVLHANNDLLGG